MATGTGKTVVMGALIVYHFYNRLEYRSDVRFADNFLLIAPGITIRDRLAALRVDSRDGSSSDDYYHIRFLVPTEWAKELQQLNAKLIIVNFHNSRPEPFKATNARRLTASSDPTDERRRRRKTRPK